MSAAHNSFRTIENLQSLGCAIDLDAGESHVMLHGLEFLPPANLHHLGRLDPLSEHLGGEASAQGMEFDGWKTVDVAEAPQDFRLQALLPFPGSLKDMLLGACRSACR